MTIRERLENEEDARLSPLAVRARDSRGRERLLAPCDLRTAFQRDRDRIIHCKSFRRLKYKTQVFLSPEGDHYRTRLTHTLEVAQVARTLARALRLNEDLTEAIALGHDLGHTPFGHIGERTLDRLMPDGFRHNEQSLRVADKLEGDSADGGLNLTWEVRDGILCHSGKQEPATLEGWCVRRADRVAYINHDIDDALRGGILRPDELPRDCLRVLGETHGQRIDTMIRDIVQTSAEQPFIRMSDAVSQATDALRDFLFQRVYNDGWRAAEEKRCDNVLSRLYAYFMEHPAEMPLEYVTLAYQDGVQRAVGDYIACMTDRFAVSTFQRLFVPTSFPLR